MSSVLLIADHPAIAAIGARLDVGAKEAGDRIFALSPRLSAVLAGRRLGLNIQMLRRNTLPEGVVDRYHEHNFEVQTGYMTKTDAKALHDSFVAAASKVIAPNPGEWSLILVWNGGMVSGCAAKTIAATFKIPILFMEIANISGRMIFDPEGSNSDAAVSKRPEILDNYPIDDETFQKWKQDFVQAKRQQRILPQVKGFVPPNYAFFIDWIGGLLGAVPNFSVGPWNRIKNIIAKKIWQPRLERFILSDLPNEPFVFLPLQVSNDTNLVVRSQIDNIEAINIAIKLASENGWKVVAKVHPAEREGAFFSKLCKVQNENASMLCFTNANTADCIMKSECVMTINSTAGLEARVMGVGAIVLQPALYTGWSERNMAQFALRYTVAFDRYDSAPASAELWREILSRRKFEAN